MNILLFLVTRLVAFEAGAHTEIFHSPEDRSIDLVSTQRGSSTFYLAELMEREEVKEGSFSGVNSPKAANGIRFTMHYSGIAPEIVLHAPSGTASIRFSGAEASEMIGVFQRKNYRDVGVSSTKKGEEETWQYGSNEIPAVRCVRKSDPGAENVDECTIQVTEVDPPGLPEGSVFIGSKDPDSSAGSLVKLISENGGEEKTLDANTREWRYGQAWGRIQTDTDGTPYYQVIFHPKDPKELLYPPGYHPVTGTVYVVGSIAKDWYDLFVRAQVQSRRVPQSVYIGYQKVIPALPLHMDLSGVTMDVLDEVGVYSLGASNTYGGL